MPGLTLSIHGARGTAAEDGAGVAQHGGATSCATLTWGDPDAILVLDAGSGAAAAGPALAGRRRITVLLSHLHLDHLVGLPLLLSAAPQGAELRVASAAMSPAALEGALRRLMAPPFYPVAPETLCPGFAVTGMPGRLLDGPTLGAAPLSHPGGASGYRVAWEGRSLAYLTDHEPDGGVGDAGLRGLAEGADLALIDATWTPGEAASRRGWGHGDWRTALDLTQGAGQVGLWHHAPGRSDDELDAIVEDARQVRPGTFAAAAGQVGAVGQVGDFSPGS
ncbi:MBL fold metallo-hydrolase [Tropicimonas sp. IMCC34011]|uniref:MBL fold metallo-hydrolase n=1 Tax=Tropicimonas sp. IMCC34011 TaxID=2248759 RepID=UPI000E257CB6|nr:MBL fold metallo-hydrolase [Tropicimonas sp. IMCC34011]